MSGVILEDGQQWEHCNCCGAWVKIQELLYEKPSHEHEFGRDLCVDCAWEIQEGKTPEERMK